MSARDRLPSQPPASSKNEGDDRSELLSNRAAEPTLTFPGKQTGEGHSGVDTRQERTSQFSARSLGALAGSPRGVMILVPLLVLLLGAALTIIGQTALSATSNKMAKERFAEHTTSTGLRLEHALGLAEPLLDQLERLARSIEPDRLSDEQHQTSLGLELHDLLVGRQAITQAYIALSSGQFLSADPQGDGRVTFQITEAGISRSYQVEGQALRGSEQRESSYDPTRRDWYVLAARTGDRIWSQPYAFYYNRHPGVTRALPVYKDKEKTKLLAVVGVDFDVDALTKFMASGESASEAVHSVVFTLQGVVLAYPKGAAELARLPRNEQVATHAALGDPALSALVRRVQDLNPDQRDQALIDFSVDSDRFLSSIRHLGAGGPDWYIATFAPERTIFQELHSHRSRSLWIGSISLLVATALGWFLARHILHVRRVASEAQAAAREAQDQVLNLGSYRLISQIGEGGMGEVWRARHRLLAREAAIKLIKPNPDNHGRHDEHRERFRREAQAIAGLRSRNTVALFDYGLTGDGTLFYVMELLDGIDLSTLVTRHGPQPQERVRQILIQVCGSLAEAHRAQLVHRDVKPANLFLCREAEEVDVVKVLDFGLVFQVGLNDVAQDNQHDVTRSLEALGPVVSSKDTDPIGRITRPEHQLGTPAFMSPEQALGNETDARSDLYSLGCVGWWLLTGKPPFRASNQISLMLKHIEDKLPDLAQVAPGTVAPALQKILESCLEKSTAHRIQSAEALGEALRALGELSPPWTEQGAHEWWKEHMPQATEFKPNLSLPPLRGARVLPPTTHKS